LAQRTLAEAARDTSARVRHAFRLATAREPSKVESEALRELLGRQFAQYRRNPKAARELLSVGESPWDSRLDLAELAAWTTVASAILNLDETITRE
jgi:hypothetical protein